MCQVCPVMSNLKAQLDSSPEDLYSNSAKFEIKIDSMRENMKNEFNDLQKGLEVKGHDIKIDCNDRYFSLRRLLARDQEYTEEDADLKKMLSLVCISSNVLLTLLEYLSNTVRDYSKIDKKSHKHYYKHYVRIQDTFDSLDLLAKDHDKLVNNIRKCSLGPWFVELPYPDDTVNLVSDAMIDLKNGYLSAPLLRTYFEIKSSIIVQNSINALVRDSSLPQFKGKKIVFERSMEFGDLLTILGKFKILSPQDIDIISRMHDYTSKSIHIGAFLERSVIWYLLIYLKNVKFETAMTDALLQDFINKYIHDNKFTVISQQDKIREYSKFQTPSSQIK
jgi:hypothetical protein